MRNATLSQYIDSLAGVPLPSREERDHFVDFVANSHSWYKAPVWPPRIVFYFFVHKFAGFSDVKTVNAEKVIVPVPQLEPGPHHSMITTAEHQSRFGHLDHSHSQPPTAYVFETSVVKSNGRDTTLRGAERRGVPTEIVELGKTVASGVISPLVNNLLFSDRWIESNAPSDWPEESGGPAVLEQFRTHARQRRQGSFAERSEDPERFKRDADAFVHDLLLPERNRQLAEMGKAIDRVCEFVEKART